MVTWEDATGNGGASEGGEGRGGRWRGRRQEQQSLTTTMTNSLPLLHLQLKKYQSTIHGGRLWPQDDATGNGGASERGEGRGGRGQGGWRAQQQPSHQQNRSGDTAMSRQQPTLNKNNQLRMVGRLDVVCNRGVKRRQWKREKTTRGRRSATKPIPSTKLVGWHNNNNENEMINT